MQPKTETAKDMIPNIQSEAVRLFSLRKFYRTREAIKKGIPLWKRSSAELKSAGFMGPWTANFYKSILVGLPVSITIWFIDLIIPYDIWHDLFYEWAWNSDYEATYYELEVARISTEIMNLIIPFMVPLGLFLFSWFASRASLRKQDLSPEKTIRARHAYLYFDASHGLTSELILAFLFSIGVILFERGINIYESVFYLSAILIASLWLTLVEGYVITSKLFVANGYSPTIPFLFFGIWDKNRGPINKYHFWLYTAQFIFFLFIIILSIFIEIFSSRLVTTFILG